MNNLMQGWTKTSHLQVFLGKGVLKMPRKFTGENPCRSVISINVHNNFIEITLWHGCSPVNLLHISRTLFLQNTTEHLRTTASIRLQDIPVAWLHCCDELNIRCSRYMPESFKRKFPSVEVHRIMKTKYKLSLIHFINILLDKKQQKLAQNLLRSTEMRLGNGQLLSNL